MMERAAPRTVTLATTTLGCLSFFVVALISVHLLRPDYSPRDHFISDYAVGPYGWLMTSAFVALSAACATLAAGLLMDGPSGWLARSGAVLLCVCALGLIVTAIFPTDVPGAPPTPSGDIHELSFRVNVGSLILAILQITVAIVSSPRWRSYRTGAAVLAACTIAAAWFQFSTLHKGAPYGYANRLLVAAILTWLGATTVWLRRQALAALRDSSPHWQEASARSH